MLTVLPASEQIPWNEPDRARDRSVDVVEPGFNLATLPTTLRLPQGSFAFRLTHRFSRSVDGGPGFIGFNITRKFY